jgi:hypothetical protein
MRTHENQFGKDYPIPEEIQALVRAGQLRDISWGNDACPCFEITDDGSVRLWVEHPVSVQRESRAPRFVITLYDEADTYLGTALASESLPEVLHYLADHHDLKSS